MATAAPWCSLCLSPRAVPSRAAVLGADTPGAAPVTGVRPVTVPASLRRQGRHGAAGGPARDVDDLALAWEGPAGPVRGWGSTIAGWSPAARVLAVAAGAVAMTCLLILGMTLVGTAMG
jgi:hypothetical protein